MHITGKGVSEGMAIAPVRFFERTVLNAERRIVANISAEVSRFESARALAATQLGELSVQLGDSIGEKNSLLFEIHQMMLEDLDYRESVVGMIENESLSADFAVSETAKQFAKMFASMDDEYMQARAADVQDVSRRVLEILAGKQRIAKIEGTPVILASDDFAPSETAQFDRNMVMGLVTSGGSPNSHTAIFARTMGIPAVIGLGEQLQIGHEGQMLILDGSTGDVWINPEPKKLAECREKQNLLAQNKQSLEKFRGLPTTTKSGKTIDLFANIGSVADAELAMENDAEGVGLFRSEFLFLEAKDYPTEEAQYSAYRAVAKKMQGRKVVIRTLDIGADKQVDYFNLPSEENPALGMRAIRICLTRPKIFKTQIRALLRASAHGNIAIMLPMIISLDEVRRAKKLIADAKEELRAEGVLFGQDIQVGIMVETPAAAIISDLLAKEVDFFSIGTNDLTQYTLAVDRMNDSVSEFCDEHHEAVLRLIKTVADNAHANGIWVGICGELGADKLLTKTFIDMGIDELSVSPSAILGLRKKIVEL